MTTDIKDTIEIHDIVQGRLGQTFTFAMENPARLRSFIDLLGYCFNWGKNRNNLPTGVKVYLDHLPHSYIFAITTYRWARFGAVDEEFDPKLEPNAEFTLALIYDQNEDKWSCHS